MEQRDRMIQAERVAAWRELARRLAHELKNPLFPLQITIENLQRSRDASPEQFDEVFRESTSTLLAELGHLKTIIGRFSDFAKMPAPQLEPVDVNQIAREVIQLFEAQLQAPGQSADRNEVAARGGCRPSPGRSGSVAPGIEESGFERAGRDAAGRNAYHPNRAPREQGGAGSVGHGRRSNARRMRSFVHALLHDQTTRHGTGPGHCAVGGERS